MSPTVIASRMPAATATEARRSRLLTLTPKRPMSPASTKPRPAASAYTTCPTACPFRVPARLVWAVYDPRHGMSPGSEIARGVLELCDLALQQLEPELGLPEASVGITDVQL